MRIKPTIEDDNIFYILGLGDDSPGNLRYEMEISDRNDYALIAGLTLISREGCRATKNRMLAGN